jgi:hypothetical protein
MEAASSVAARGNALIVFGVANMLNRLLALRYVRVERFVDRGT